MSRVTVMMLSEELDSVMLLSDAHRVGGLICFLRFLRRCLCRDSLQIGGVSYVLQKQTLSFKSTDQRYI